MVGHQLVISLAYYNHNLALQLLQWKHYLLLRRSYDGAKIFATQNPGGVHVPPPCTCLRAPMLPVSFHSLSESTAARLRRFRSSFHQCLKTFATFGDISVSNGAQGKHNRSINRVDTTININIVNKCDTKIARR